MVYKFCVINHKSLHDRGMLERNQILERRRGSELDLYMVRIGSSTCVTKEIAAEVRSNKDCQALTRNERRIGASIKKIRQRYMMRHAYAQWKKVVQRTRQAVLSDGDKKQKFFLSLWNLKANKEKIKRTKEEKERRARRASRLSSSSDDSSILYKIKEDAHEIIAPDWKETEDDDTMNMIKDTANVKLKIMNVATAMATLGMANTRGLEDPSVGPMLLSHAFQSRIHLLEESRAFSLIHQKKQEWFHSLPAVSKTQKNTNTRNKYRRYARYTTEHVRKELIKIHDAYQTLRKKYEGKYPRQVPTAAFKGNYGTLRISTMEQAKAFTDRENDAETEYAQMVDEYESQQKQVKEEAPKVNLFKKKGAAIGKLASMNIGSKAERNRLREEHEKNVEMFKQKRESIKKEQEIKKKMSLKMNQLQLELGLDFDDEEYNNNKTDTKDDDLLSVSSGGDGEVFVHNLMGFWT